MAVSKDNFFNPAKKSAEEKAATTHDTAMQIIDAETAARLSKTERLRELRKQHEEAHPAPPPKTRRSKAK